MSASDPTIAELLQQASAAIYALLTHRVASYTVGGISYTYQDLDKLRKLRADLLEESANDATTGTRRMIRLGDIAGT